MERFSRLSNREKTTMKDAGEGIETFKTPAEAARITLLNSLYNYISDW